MIKKYETSICSNQDGLELSVLWLEPEKEPKGILQISHGMSEYKERYLPFMRYLCERGYLCAIHDHRGHGKSLKNEEDIGYFYENEAEAVIEAILFTMGDSVEISRLAEVRSEERRVGK